jgi:DNA helicase-2/ATP-dependent DNA helicase PcrA
VNFEDLTGRQRAVVCSARPVTLVLGSAGTGKTTVALWAARHHLEKDPNGGCRVLFLTFSRTAVSQINSRSAGVTRGLENRLEVATFDGLAYRLIRAFGRYVGFGSAVPEVQSEARQRLLGVEPNRLTYGDLVPAALRIAQAPFVGDLVRSRWSMIVCDEFQDTSDAQWRLLDRLAAGKRLLLLADENQMIYTWVDGVGPQRLAQARLLADEVIELEPASHRDPSGCIPAMATAVRRREWNHDAIRAAVSSGRLRVMAGVDQDDQLIEVLRGELRGMRCAGCRSVGIFGHSNTGVVELGSALHRAGIPHALIGIPEAQGEAIATMGPVYSSATEPPQRRSCERRTRRS